MQLPATIEHLSGSATGSSLTDKAAAVNGVTGNPSMPSFSLPVINLRFLTDQVNPPAMRRVGTFPDEADQHLRWALSPRYMTKSGSLSGSFLNNLVYSRLSFLRTPFSLLVRRYRKSTCLLPWGTLALAAQGVISETGGQASLNNCSKLRPNISYIYIVIYCI